MGSIRPIPISRLFPHLASRIHRVHYGLLDEAGPCFFNNFPWRSNHHFIAQIFHEWCVYIYTYIHVMWCNVDVDVDVDVDGMYYIPYIYSMYIIQTIQKFMDDHMPTFISTISRSCKHPKTIDSMGDGQKILCCIFSAHACSFGPSLLFIGVNSLKVYLHDEHA